MSDLVITKFPNQILRKKCHVLENFGEAEKKLAEDMTQTMYRTRGIGLAAPQVGVSKSIIVFDAGTGLFKMINPRIVSNKGRAFLEEGCLSIPDKCVNVKRSEEISVSYIDENNNERVMTFDGLTARVIQHEIDHINGKLIIDYLPWYKKIL